MLGTWMALVSMLLGKYWTLNILLGLRFLSRK